MSIHKLTAGSGYDYLTRQVAALDATEKGHTGLASYYTERGETPGVWVGSGMASLDGLAAGDVVTVDQMQSLFGSGHHPLATERAAALEALAGRSNDPTDQEDLLEYDLGGPGTGRPATEKDRRAATRLGVPYKVYAGDVSPFRIEVAKRIAAVNQAAGLPSDWPVPTPERSRIRTQVATEFFRTARGRDPADARELAGQIAKGSRPRTTAVAGYDLTFSPVKSVSVLWAIADPATAVKIELAHQAAVADALAFIEQNALFTRTGTNGVRQVDVKGLVATAFTHRDSRDGDPDLHTHVAVANKVQTHSPDGNGRWLSIDGRVMFKATVAASETYNTALEWHLIDALGVQFAERPNPDARKRPVREIVGVEATLNERFSKRSLSIEARRSQLTADFQASHGRPPTPIESIRLAQQATLETREAKHEPRTLAEQRTTWHQEATAALGSTKRLQQMLHDTLSPTAPCCPARSSAGAARPLADSAWLTGWVPLAADRVVAAMEQRGSTWQVWHVYAEAQRQVRAAPLLQTSTGQVDHANRLVDLLVQVVLKDRSVTLARPDTISEPAELRRRDGSSVYTVAGADLFSSARVMAAEKNLVVAAGRVDGHQIPHAAVDVALLESIANGVELNAGQASLVRDMATSGARLQLAIAPAGSGKTTAMRALSAAWTHGAGGAGGGGGGGGGAAGTVIGLAPSAAAAAALRDQLGDQLGQRHDTYTDTLAKLTWSLQHRSADRSGHPATAGRDHVELPDWVEKIGPQTLVVIDEAGMADTLSLSTAVDFVIARGGSVRLIGDDQQLAAIGAGGVLRDIQATHGVLRLSELLRYADPAEGAATLALREGKCEALGFYLDHDRVHVGDLATITENVFSSWLADRSNGLDSIMLAPTRELVSELNQRARAHRLSGLSPQHSAAPGAISGVISGPLETTVRLADGNEASVGELIITRTNDRRLRTSATDWVKNGDRWRVLEVHDQAGRNSRGRASLNRGPAWGVSDLTVQHTQNGRVVRLPAGYVQASTELGYATTVHTAQGVSVDTMHGLASGQESRQQLYTMMTRGRTGNHLYLQVVGDGDPHSVIRPELVRPLTPTDLLEQILARDDSPTSATTLVREQGDPAARLTDATSRYLDALYIAAESVLGMHVTERLDQAAAQLVPGISDAPAWPPLRAHLMLLGAHGTDPIDHLRAAVAQGELDSAADVAAVLDWRLDDTGMRSTGSDACSGPLPWAPGIPAALATDKHWGHYLSRRAQLVTALANQVHDRAFLAASTGAASPIWTQHSMSRAPDVVADVEVWRAATGVAPTDHRPTGPAQLQNASARWQRGLNRRLIGDRTPALAEWGPLLERLAPGVVNDDFTPQLADRLAAMSRAGVNTPALLRCVIGNNPNPAASVNVGTDTSAALPDDHAAAALWWRLFRQLSPAVAEQIDSDHTLATPWLPRLPELIGADAAARLQTSPSWPTLVTTLDHGLQRGWKLEDLLALPPAVTTSPDDIADPYADPCEALVWRASLMMRPIPIDEREDPADFGYEPRDAPPEDMWEGVEPPAHEDTCVVWAPEPQDSINPRETTPHREEPVTLQVHSAGTAETRDIEAALTMAGIVRNLRTPLEQTDAEINRMLERGRALDTAPVSRERMLEVNDLTLGYFEDHFTRSWGRDYLGGRFGQDLAGDPDFRPGQAPADWTGLARHLRQRGVTDQEMLATGVASTARTGRLIDRFRDRVMFPITTHHNGAEEILGFIGRRHPDFTDADQAAGKAGPKYLNTAETPLFHKGAQLFGVLERHLQTAAIPVLVEGPTDAIAVTMATGGIYLGVASLGTAFTDEQATQLAQLAQSAGRQPIVATDADLSGRIAAERDFWMLTPHGLDPRFAQLPQASDPADLLFLHGPAAVAAALTPDRALGQLLLDERLTNLPPEQARVAAIGVLAALPPSYWDPGARQITKQLGVDLQTVRHDLRAAVTSWDTDPRTVAHGQLSAITAVHGRLAATFASTPTEATRPIVRSVEAPAAAPIDGAAAQRRQSPTVVPPRPDGRGR